MFPNGVNLSGSSSNSSVHAAEVKYPASVASRVALDSTMTPEAGDPTTFLDMLYEPKPNERVYKIMTVVAYIFCVSFIAILLSTYYIFLWDPYIDAFDTFVRQHNRSNNDNNVVGALVRSSAGNLAKGHDDPFYSYLQQAQKGMEEAALVYSDSQMLSTHPRHSPLRQLILDDDKNGPNVENHKNDKNIRNESNDKDIMDRKEANKGEEQEQEKKQCVC